MTKLQQDIGILIGAGSMLYGVWQIYSPLCYIFAGLFLFYVCVNSGSSSEVTSAG